MKSMFVLILLSLIVGISAFFWFIFSSKKEQFDDIEGPKYRMLDDEDDDIETPKEK